MGTVPPPVGHEIKSQVRRSAFIDRLSSPHTVVSKYVPGTDWSDITSAPGEGGAETQGVPDLAPFQAPDLYRPWAAPRVLTPLLPITIEFLP